MFFFEAELGAHANFFCNRRPEALWSRFEEDERLMAATDQLEGGGNAATQAERLARRSEAPWRVRLALLSRALPDQTVLVAFVIGEERSVDRSGKSGIVELEGEVVYP